MFMVDTIPRRIPLLLPSKVAAHRSKGEELYPRTQRTLGWKLRVVTRPRVLQLAHPSHKKLYGLLPAHSHTRNGQIS